MEPLPPALMAYRVFLDTLPDGAIVAGERTIVFANARAEALLGWPPGGLDGVPLAELGTDVDLGTSTQALAGGASDPERAHREVSFRHRDGHILVAEIAHNGVVLDGRSLVLSVLRDNTDRRRVEEAVRTSEELLRQAVLVANLGIFNHDQVRNEIYWSPEQRAIHGWGADQPVTLDDFADLVHPDDRAWVMESVARAHNPAGDGRWEVEHRIIRPDGQVRWLLSRSQTFFERLDGRLQPVRTVGAIADVTEQRLAADVLQMFRTSIDEASDAIFWIRSDGSIPYANDEACRLLGYTREEFPDVRIWDIDPSFPPEAWAARWAEFERTRQRVIQRVTTRQRRKDGSVFPAEVVIQHLPVGDSTLHVAYVRDLTEQLRLEASLRQAQRMEAVGQLAGGIAHDFNNLLTAIRGYGELARDPAASEGERRADLDEIIATADRAAELTRGLLAFGRRAVLRPEVLDPAAVIGGIFPLLRRLIGEHIKIEVRATSGAGYIRVDRSELEQVIVNLSVNARDAMPAGGTLLIATRAVELDAAGAARIPEAKPGSYVELSVSDTGSGMSEATQARIFEPFFTTKPTGEGTGLGLATVHGIVHQSGGAITVESEPGRGSTFRILLPAVEEQRTETLAAATAATATGGSETILLAEDEAPVREFARRVLTDHGYTVLAASDGLDALRLASTYEPAIDLLVTDVVMPGLNGPDLTRQVASLRPGIRALFISGYVAPAVDQVLFASRAYVPKPFTTTALLRIVRETLDAPEADRADQ